MTKDAKKVWKVMESEFGWSNPPKDFHLEYFEDIIKATKKALTIPVVVGKSEQLGCKFCGADEGLIHLYMSDGEPCPMAKTA